MHCMMSNGEGVVRATRRGCASDEMLRWQRGDAAQARRDVMQVNRYRADDAMQATRGCHVCDERILCW